MSSTEKFEKWIADAKANVVMRKKMLQLMIKNASNPEFNKEAAFKKFLELVNKEKEILQKQYTEIVSLSSAKEGEELQAARRAYDSLIQSAETELTKKQEQVKKPEVSQQVKGTTQPYGRIITEKPAELSRPTSGSKPDQSNSNHYAKLVNPPKQPPSDDTKPGYVKMPVQPQGGKLQLQGTEKVQPSKPVTPITNPRQVRLASTRTEKEGSRGYGSLPAAGTVRPGVEAKKDEPFNANPNGYNELPSFEVNKQDTTEKSPAQPQEKIANPRAARTFGQHDGIHQKHMGMGGITAPSNKQTSTVSVPKEEKDDKSKERP